MMYSTACQTSLRPMADLLPFSIQESHGGGPALAATDVCLECLEGSFSTALLGSRADQVGRGNAT